MKRPMVGEISQFIHGRTHKITACVITGWREDNILAITYRSESGEIIEDALIHVMHIISDEDAAIHDFP